MSVIAHLLRSVTGRLVAAPQATIAVRRVGGMSGAYSDPAARPVQAAALLHQPWSDQPLLVLDGDRPWIVTAAEHDPYTRRGRTVVPHAQRRELARLAAQDVPFERIAIAHELDPRGPVRPLLPALRDGPRTCTPDVARQVAGPLAAHPGLARASSVFGRLAGATTSAVAVLLDPIVFGVVAPQGLAHGAPALWYPLVAWRW